MTRFEHWLNSLTPPFFGAFLLVLSSTTAGVIIAGSWCASQPLQQMVAPSGTTVASVDRIAMVGSHGVRRALEPRAWELTESVPGLALSSSDGSDPLRIPQRHSTVRAQGASPEREAGDLMPSPPGLSQVFEGGAEWMDTQVPLNAGSALPAVKSTAKSGIAGINPGRHLQALATIAAAASHLCGVPQSILFALISRESSWRQYDKAGQTLRSRSNALGLTQIKASTARGEVSPTLDLSTPFGNLVAGSCYLRKMYDRFGDWGTALKAYRIGPNSPELHSKTASEYSADIMERSSN